MMVGWFPGFYLSRYCPEVGPALVPLYNLYPSSAVIAMAGVIARVMRWRRWNKPHIIILPEGLVSRWTSTAYQQIVAGNATYLCLVWLCSWFIWFLGGNMKVGLHHCRCYAVFRLALLGVTIVLSLLAFGYV